MALSKLSLALAETLAKLDTPLPIVEAVARVLHAHDGTSMREFWDKAVTDKAAIISIIAEILKPRRRPEPEIETVTVSSIEELEELLERLRKEERGH